MSAGCLIDLCSVFFPEGRRVWARRVSGSDHKGRPYKFIVIGKRVMPPRELTQECGRTQSIEGARFPATAKTCPEVRFHPRGRTTDTA